MSIEIKCAYDEIVAIKDLKPHSKNPNRHSDSQIERLAEIIKYQGIRRPIRVSKLSGCITAGHGLLGALRKLKESDCPVNYQDYKDEEQEFADIVADNSIASWAELDLGSINLEVPNLGPDFDINVLGLKDFEIDPADKYGDKDADDVPDVRETFVKLGDLYQLGNHRLLCGSSTNQEDIERLMNGELAHMVFTSPPYNQKINTFKPSGMQKENRSFVKRISQAYDDDKPEEEYQSEQIYLLDRLYNFLTPNGSVFYNHKIRYRDKEIVSPYAWLSKTKFKIRQEIIWNKKATIAFNARMFYPIDERIYWLIKDEFHFNDTQEIKAYSSIWTITDHPEIKISAPFPNELPLRGILACSNPNDIVVEPYCGTGTTLIAAEKLGRRCLGMEIDPYYCSVIIERWQKFTGLKAIKVE